MDVLSENDIYLIPFNTLRVSSLQLSKILKINLYFHKFKKALFKKIFLTSFDLDYKVLIKIKKLPLRLIRIAWSCRGSFVKLEFIYDSFSFFVRFSLFMPISLFAFFHATAHFLPIAWIRNRIFVRIRSESFVNLLIALVKNFIVFYISLGGRPIWRLNVSTNSGLVLASFGHSPLIFPIVCLNLWFLFSSVLGFPNLIIMINIISGFVAAVGCVKNVGLLIASRSEGDGWGSLAAFDFSPLSPVHGSWF